MTTYYKATSVDGLSFQSGPDGPVDYGAALVSQPTPQPAVGR